MRHLPVRVCVAFAVATALLLSVGCRRKVEYQTILIDQPTQPGEVPPPVEQTRVEPYRPYAEAAPPAQAPDPAATAADFGKAYGAAKKPRIALYTNRTLSGDVREWESDVRGTVGFGATTTKEKDGEKSVKQTEGAVTVSRERRVDDGAGKFLEQKWAWTLEDSMQSGLVNAGAKIVDRRIIMRSMAADQPHTAH
ncbi:MAG: hypothetical protein GY851_02195, partial [bacterium]|nr:hypothetical protein [bacterium]